MPTDRIRPYTSTSTRTCQFCSKDFNIKGFGSHEKACRTHTESAKRDRAFEEELAEEALAYRRAKRARVIEEKINKILQASSRVNEGNPPPPDRDLGIGRQEQVDDSLAFDAHTYEADIDQNVLDTESQDTHIPAVSTASSSQQVQNEQQLLDDIKVEYHPGSGRDAKVFHFDEFTRKNTFQNLPTDNEPWRPFRCHNDYEFSRIALEAALSAGQVNDLIKLIKDIAGGARFTLSGSKDVTDTWKAASLKLTPFEKTEIKVPYKKDERKYEVWSRPLWSYAVELLEDTRLMPYFVWDAERLFKYDGYRFVRFIDEPWTADMFWNIQSALPTGSHPLCFILYADKNKLSTFGTVKGYPVIARCANLHVEIRNGNGIGGGRIVGWLPIVEDDATTSKLLSFTNHKRRVWHMAVYEIVKSIISLSKVGFTIKCGDGIKRRVFPCISILSADYEEQAFMALIRGATADFPCPVCLVKRQDLTDLSIVPTLRTATETKKLVDEAFELSQKEAEKKLKDQGLRMIKNVFWDVANSDPHKAISWDRLHAYSSGVFGGHMWKEFKSVLASIGREFQEKLEHNFSVFPRFRNLHHFNGVLHICFNDGSKFEDLGKQLLYAAHNVITPKDSPSCYLLLRCLRSYLELDAYLSFEVHTENTIAAGERELLNFSKLIAEYSQVSSQEFDDPKDWKFIKMHLQRHAFADIRAKGVTKNYNTKPNEKFHGPIRDSYHLRTNYRDVAKQILDADHHLLVSSLIKSQIRDLEVFKVEQLKSEEMENTSRSTEVEHGAELLHDELNEEASGPIDFEYQHFSLGSTEKKPVTMSYIEQSNATDLAFKDFRKKLSSYLNTTFQAHQIPLPGNRRIQVAANDLATVHRYLKVSYESMVTWKLMTDHLRCNPKFFGHPRYDFVIFQVVDKEIFGQLIFMFTVFVSETAYPIALVQPCDAPNGVPRFKDLELGLTRVKARPRSKAEFISIHSIRRGAVLVADSDKVGEYVVMDVLDADMFLRVKDMNDAY